jgi:bifunctional N-acetylglucosamine-1-phosphate-uridyltransferase/glucosamine-1-phosphate-acetyltransferase GlmU-like protein
MLQHLLELHRAFVERLVIVASPGAADDIRGRLKSWSVAADVTIQEEPTGMLDAILLGITALHERALDRVWITWGDQVAVRRETLARLAEIETGTDLALPTLERDDPYIHFDRDGAGRISGVRQRREGDRMPPRGENDLGLFSLSARAAREWLAEYASGLAPGAGTGERNFVPFVAWAAARGIVRTCPATDPIEAVGINTPEELAAVEHALRER